MKTHRPLPTFLACLAGCILILTSACHSGCDKNTKTVDNCGDGVCQGTEDATDCFDDCGCGNGVANIAQGEQCDGAEFNGMTCLDYDCATGTLACDQNCRIQTNFCSDCDTCGDGVKDGTDECDCGEDPNNLPAGCTDINGGPNANCTADCECMNTCGDGTVELCEECDCGTDSGNLPTGCTEVNGPTGECSATCEINEPCTDPSKEHFEECNPALQEPCCPDDYGTETYCETQLNTPTCLIECSSTDDCYYNMFCANNTFCMIAFCGAGTTWLSGTLVNEPCQVPGGGTGWCWPLWRAQDDAGVCIEDGTVAPGDACDGSYIDLTNQPRSMTWNRCDNGWCPLSSPTCRGFCDPVDVFENETNSDYCPAGTNCFSYSYIYDQGCSPPDCNDGCRASDRGECIVQSTDPNTGDYTCDVTTGELIADRSQVCTDVQAGLMCIPLDFTDGPGFGTRIGACRSIAATVNTYWQACTPGTDTCPEGSECFNEDIFGAGTGQNRCIPFCDTTNAVPCYQQHNQLPTDNRCTSMSLMFAGGPCTEPPAFRSKLGLCACPLAGCGAGWCGNDVIDGSETCDGSDVGIHTCTYYGFGGGVMGCAATCDATDPANCT